MERPDLGRAADSVHISLRKAVRLYVMLVVVITANPDTLKAMKYLTPPAVATTSEVRHRLPSYLDLFRKAGADADPIFVGAYRRPEGVLLSYQAFEAMLNRLEDLEIAAQARERLTDGSEPIEETVEDLAERLGISSDELRSNAP